MVAGEGLDFAFLTPQHLTSCGKAFRVPRLSSRLTCLRSVPNAAALFGPPGVGLPEREGLLK